MSFEMDKEYDSYILERRRNENWNSRQWVIERRVKHGKSTKKPVDGLRDGDLVHASWRGSKYKRDAILTHCEDAASKPSRWHVQYMNGRKIVPGHKAIVPSNQIIKEKDEILCSCLSSAEIPPMTGCCGCGAHYSINLIGETKTTLCMKPR